MSLTNGEHSPTMKKYLEKNVFAEGELLKKILDLTLQEKLTTKDDEERKVVNFKHPHELQKILPLSINYSGCQSIEEIENILQQVVRYSVKTSHPHFYNQLFGGVDEVGLSAAWLLEALNTNVYTFEAAPVFVILEHYMVQQLCRFFGWDGGDGIFSPGGSISNMYSIALARHYKYPETKESGLFGRKELSHYSIQKGASFMGFGSNQVVVVPSDENGRMRAGALRKTIHRVKEEGREPLIACWGGAVILSDKHKHLLKGVESHENLVYGLADSIAWNPHKMICVALQCSAFLVKHKGLLSECNRSGASYLFQQDKFYDVSFDTGDKSIQCGRKADAFKLWFMFKIHGLDVFKKRVENAFEAASYLEREIENRNGFRLVLKQRECTNVCFWYIPPSLRGQPDTKEWWMKMHKVSDVSEARKPTRQLFIYLFQTIDLTVFGNIHDENTSLWHQLLRAGWSRKVLSWWGINPSNANTL
ncbi:Cysteine sulfinic acid decarboxylase [Armadillidium nasatum]|uniref:Cysteine sulfinic acid decarboxylase n=1 Tax=Armadillidium nasatum TaxID=96803 RepID=A0A5N5SRP2_9CRUS|nr:Cysteine sulfinic acid decarboxylase [Armadillidium nasatum]